MSYDEVITDQVIRENPASRGTETSAEVLVAHLSERRSTVRTARGLSQGDPRNEKHSKRQPNGRLSAPARSTHD